MEPKAEVHPEQFVSVNRVRENSRRRDETVPRDGEQDDWQIR